MSEAPRDEVIPRGAWQFDQEVTAVFDDMLQRSIPQYNAMRMVTFEVGRRFVQPGTAIIDMGCSRGQALLPFVSRFAAANDYIGLEISEPMIQAARQNFNYHPHGNRVTIQSADLRHEFPGVTSSLVLSVLTLQFTPTSASPTPAPTRSSSHWNASTASQLPRPTDSSGSSNPDSFSCGCGSWAPSPGNWRG